VARSDGARQMVNDDFEPAYRSLHRRDELRPRVEAAYRRLHACDLCGRDCGVDRAEATGACQAGMDALVASHGPHMGEEDPLRGRRGSGTIFFAYCNLNCEYCQNYDISQYGHGKAADPEMLAAMMLNLAQRGCHNVNLVSPTHFTPQILAAVFIAAEAGLSLPLVWNTGGYDSIHTLSLLDGVVDIYMPDMKYADEAIARRYSGIPRYPQVNQAAVKEIHRQVGDLTMNRREIAQRGLLVRHLVLPEGLAGTEEIVQFLADEISRDTYINLMDQYRPCYHAGNLPPLDRPITRQEYRRARAQARAAGLHRFAR